MRLNKSGRKKIYKPIVSVKIYVETMEKLKKLKDETGKPRVILIEEAIDKIS